MKKDWKEWLQIFSNLAILVGIILVLLEMQQTQTIAQAELGSESMGQRLDFALTLIGESSEEIVAKACFEPDDLTDEDKLQLRRIMRARILIIGRSQGIERITGFGGDWESSARQGFGQLFSVPYLRELYRNDRAQVPQAFQAAADRALEGSASDDCSVGFRLMNTL